MFYSRTNLPPFQPVSSGNFFSQKYVERVNVKTGETYLEEDGKINNYEMIQACKGQCDIHAILQKFELSRDPNLLNRVNGFFADVSRFPTNLIEAHNLTRSVTEFFDSQPKELKEAFGNNVNVFLAKVNDGSYQSILSELNKKVQPGTPVPGEPIKEVSSDV